MVRRWPVAAVFVLLPAVMPLAAQCGLLSWEEYRATRFSLPRILRIENKPGELLEFGIRHTRDPRDPQLIEVERLWAEFRPQIAFSEGGVRPATSGRDDAVMRYGEPGLLRFLADRDHVALRSMEPPEDEETKALARQFPAAHVKLFYYLRNLSAPGSSPEAALASVRHRHLNGPPDSVADFNRLMAELLPKSADSRAIPREWLDPSREDTRLNTIARASSDYRNCYMVSRFADTVRAGKRVFVLIGGSHVIVQEKALRRAIEH